MSTKRQALHRLPAAASRQGQQETPSWLNERPGAALITLKVIPRAGRNELIFEEAGPRARLTAPPVEGAANEALVNLLAARLGISRRAISIVRGATSRTKTLEIAGMSAADLIARIDLP